MSGMEIGFGWCADASGWSDARMPATGRVRLGPRGLLRLLQTRLGLSRPEVSPALRTAQYLAALRAAAPAWCAESLAVDPWSTARSVLARRDAAIEAGWSPAQAVGADALPERLRSLAEVERHLTVVIGAGRAAAGTLPLGPGAADDLIEVLDVLEGASAWPLGIARIRCEDPADLPGRWADLLAAVARAGVVVEHVEAAAERATATGSAEATEQAGAIERAEATERSPDLIVVRARDEWTAARTAARFLKASAAADDATAPRGSNEPGAPSEPTVPGEAMQVLATSTTTILDAQLRRRGLPAIGAAASSSDRASRQILPLFLALAIAPVDVQQIAAFCDLRVADSPEPGAEPLGLVPATARRALLDALTQEPGVGGEAWESALDRLDHTAATATPDDAARAERARDAARAIDELVRSPLSADQVRPSTLLATLDWLELRIRAVGGATGSLAEASAQITAFRSILAALDDAPLSPRTLQMIVEACGGRGASPLARPEASPFTTLTDPAHVRADGGTVLWWGAVQAPDPHAVEWDDDETKALEAAGARPTEPRELAALRTDAQLRGLRTAGRVIAVLVERRLEEPQIPSALLTHLAADLARSSGRSTEDELAARTIAASDLEHDGSWMLAGRTVAGVEEALAPLDTRDRIGRTDLTSTTRPAPHLAPERMSYSQAEALIGCHQKWTYKHAFRLKRAAAAEVPTGSPMIGTLVHKVAETLVRRRDERPGGAAWPPDRASIAAVFDELVPRFASELDLPGAAMERTRVRGEAVSSLVELFSRLDRAGITITGAESRFEQELPLEYGGGAHPVSFGGSRDLDARTADGQPVVIDLKWTIAKTKYPDLFDRGDSLQLASYAWSLAPDGRAIGPDPAGRPILGYFLLKQGEFVTDDRLLDARSRDPFDIEDTWDRMIHELETALGEIMSGRVTAHAGQELIDSAYGARAAKNDREKVYADTRDNARAAGGIWADPRCDYCEFSVLCGLMEDRS